MKKMELLRNAKGLTQVEAARKVGMAQPIYRNIENGLRPSKNSIILLESFFGFSITELLAELNEAAIATAISGK